MPQDRDERAEDDFLKGAYELTDVKSAMSFYSDWAGEYDDRMEGVLGYVAPKLMAEYFATAVPNRTTSILDVGCGTGLTGLYLKSHGFQTIDGIDLNSQMLAKSRARGFYRTLIEADITKHIELPTASYDGIISSGTFTLGHVGAEPIPELVRLLKPGAVLGCTIHREIWAQRGFEEQFAQLEASATLTPIERKPGEFFSGFGETAFYCLFRKA